MATRKIFVFLVISKLTLANENLDPRSRGVIDHLNAGMQFAKEFLGSESVALKVAEFVVKAFQPVSQRPSTVGDDENVDRNDKSQNQTWEQDKEPSSPLRHLVRLLGLQPAQLSAVAINALLFVAQMISTLLGGRQKPKKALKSDDLLSYILNKKSSTLQELISAAKDDSLPDLIEDMIESQGTKEETSCIRLLVCRIVPFIKNMQKSVFGKEEISNKGDKSGGISAFYRYLPTKDEINGRGEICEKRHPDCDLNYR